MSACRAADRLGALRDGEVVQQHQFRAGASTSSNWSRESTSTSHGRSGGARARAAASAAPTDPAAATWLSLISAASPARAGGSLPRRSAPRTSPAAAGPAGLAGVADAGTGAGHRVDPRPVAVATPERWHSRFSAVRSAVSRPRTAARTARAGSPAVSRAPSGSAVDLPYPSAPRTSRKHRKDGRDPASTPARGGEGADRDGVGGHGGGGGGVGAVAQVLGQCGPDDPVVFVGTRRRRAAAAPIPPGSAGSAGTGVGHDGRRARSWRCSRAARRVAGRDGRYAVATAALGAGAGGREQRGGEQGQRRVLGAARRPWPPVRVAPATSEAAASPAASRPIPACRTHRPLQRPAISDGEARGGERGSRDRGDRPSQRPPPPRPVPPPPAPRAGVRKPAGSRRADRSGLPLPRRRARTASGRRCR